MQFIKKEFPNPVLGEGQEDYKKGNTFHLIIDQARIKQTRSEIQIPCQYNLVCPGLETYIAHGDACTFLQITCTSTNYSSIRILRPEEKDAVISIPTADISREVKFTALIVAARNIENFFCKEFNPDYFGSSTFKLRKGDILAYDELLLPIDDTELDKPISSIFDVCKNNELSEDDSDIVPDFYSDKIKINLNPKLFDAYHMIATQNRGQFDRLASAVIVFPVLVEAITFIQNDLMEDDLIRNYRWYGAIIQKSKTLGIKIEERDLSAVSIASLLLKHIASDSLINFCDFINRELNSGEIMEEGQGD